MTSSSPEKNIVVLNNGTIVTFEPEMTHEAEVARRGKMYEGVILEPDGEGGFKTNGIPFDNYVTATEVCLPLLIRKIEADGAEITFAELSKKLKERDFKLLKAHVDKMVAEAAQETEKGKKNS
jgi:hypothetical protein